MSNPDATPAIVRKTSIPPFGCKPKTELEMIRELLVKEALAFQDSGIMFGSGNRQPRTIHG